MTRVSGQLDHDDVQSLVEAYLDGELDGPLGAAIDRHLKQCPDCDRKVAEARKAEERIRDILLAGTPPIDMWSSIQSRIDAQERAGARPPHRRHYLALGTAALGLLIAVLLFGSPHWQHTAIAPSLVAETPIRELKDWIVSGRPLDVRETDPHKLQSWFAGKVSFTPPLPPVAIGELELTGGRLCHFFDRAIASYMYRFDGRVVSVYVMARDGLELSVAAPAGETEPTQFRGFSNIVVSSDGLVFAIVSDLPPTERDRLKQRLRPLIRPDA